MRVSVEMKSLTWTPAQSRALHKGECRLPSSTHPSFLLEGALSLQPLIFGGLHVYKLSFFSYFGRDFAFLNPNSDSTPVSD